MTRALYGVAVFLYVLSLILPHEGVWFFGLIVALMTAILSAGAISSLGMDELASLKGVLFLLFALSPFYNLVFIWCALSFVRIKRKFEIKNIVLFVAAVFSVFVSVRFLIENSSEFWVYFLWSLSLLVLSVATVIKARNA